MRRLVPLAVVAALSSLATAAVIVIPALAEDEPSRSSAREASRPFDDEFARFAACMREKGFPFDDEVVVRVSPDGVTVNGKEVDAEAFRAAERECGGPPFLALRDLPALRGLPALGGLPGLRGLPGRRGAPGREELREQRDAFLADVARRLGVDVEKLEGALRGAAVARIDALEREGKLDAAHADALRELARSGELPPLGGPALIVPRDRWNDRLELDRPRPS